MATLCGSLGTPSANQAALDVAAAWLLGDGHVVVGIDHFASVPTFQPQLDDDAGDVVNAIRRTFESVDGVLIAVPEYAGGIAGGVKNALDWMVGSASCTTVPFRF